MVDGMSDELIGKQIGGYEIQERIGQGGMATVFRARQVSMKRDVAIKVLPRQFLNDDTYLQRFEREVEIAAQLQHRNIIPVHDYGEFDGQPYIVMRYMPAGSLDDMLRHGPLQPEQILNYFEQIAPALDYAHNRGVLHRDLKPSNVLIDDDGGAYITDFGIARILGEQGPGITTQGVVGTPSYMSPEQAQAHDLDGRSDVYSLGVMLFELLTARRPFEAETPYSIAVKQVTEAPPEPRSYNPNLSVAVEKVIYKSLEKKREHRYLTATALADGLREAIENPESATDTHPGFKLPPRPQPAAAPMQHYNTPTPQKSRPVRLPAPPSSQQGFDLRGRVRKRRQSSPLMSVAIGGMIGIVILTLIVLVAIFVIGQLTNQGATSTDIPSTEEVQSSAFDTTPNGDTATIDEGDSTQVAARETLIARSADVFATQTQLAVVATTAAARATPAATSTVPIGERATATLNPALSGVSGTIVYFDEREDSFEIVTLNLVTGIETQLTRDSSTNSHPRPSPDGSRIVFQSDRDGDYDIYTVNLQGGQLVRVTNNDLFERLPEWSLDGEWLIFSSDTRDDRTFDLYRARTDGSEFQPVFSNGLRNSHPRYSPDGLFLVFTTGGVSEDSSTWEIARLDLVTGDYAQLTNNEGRDSSASYSPDGSTILFSTDGDGGAAIAVMDANGQNARIIYDDPGFEWSASYSPDGRFIIFNSDVTGRDELYLMTADGEHVQRITQNGGAYASWIPGT